MATKLRKHLTKTQIEDLNKFEKNYFKANKKPANWSELFKLSDAAYRYFVGLGYEEVWAKGLASEVMFGNMEECD